MLTIAIFGATSAIAHATAKCFVGPDANFILIGRNQNKLDCNASDLTTRGAQSAKTILCDFSDHAQTHQIFNNMPNNINLAIIAQGVLPEQMNIEQAIAINTISPMICMEKITHLMQGGTIAVIGSVAGDRGRKSNYLYGASKAAIDTFSSGQRMRDQNIHLLLIKPGFIETPMTRDNKKGWLWRTPEEIAPKIKQAILSKKSVVYVPGFWRVIMLIIRNMPELILKRLNI